MATDAHHITLAGGGEMGALMRSIAWEATPVGPVERWPQSLRTALSILLETGFPMYIAWGAEFTQFYNDGYRPILGSTKHPSAMGRSTRDTFKEIWHIIGPMFERVMQGTPTTVVDFLLPLDRHGFTEECYFIFSYSPIREESGEVGGVLVTVTETTERVLGERRMRLLKTLSDATNDALTVGDVCAQVAVVLAAHAHDVSMPGLYLADAAQTRLTLATTSGTDRDLQWPAIIELGAGDDVFGAAQALRSRQLVFSEHLPTAFTSGRQSVEQLPSKQVALPICGPGDERPLGVLLAVTAPRALVTSAYEDFLKLLATQVGGALAAAQTLEEAQTRADQLAELNRAKTQFFNNISHEFRTPLTLILGPVEQAIISSVGTLSGEALDAVQRNSLRLLKLTNTLLDFSRIEAGRVEATFEETDLSRLTRDLGATFRSTVEAGGVSYVVDAPGQLSAFVDRDMWEQIVLNLISNAFKFTTAGQIRVALASERGRLVLRVSDTGAGIASSDLPRVFERFYRAEQLNARTYEGSGIGLALVRELVTLHGGTIDVTSELGKGTEFTVAIPTGSAHLSPARIRQPRERGGEASAARGFVAEAIRWLPGPATHADAAPLAAADIRILIADDNADMRDYLAGLLSPRWKVDTVSNGAEALVAVKAKRPDLVISDVMMPVVDGFELLRQLRSDELTRSVPVILLSARAGEEAQVDGLSAGADDYLVKPFSARELVARVETQLARARLRTLEEAHTLRLASVFAHAPVGVAILRGRDHVFEFANRPYLELIGRRAVVGRSFRLALPELASQGTLELLDDVFDSGEPYVGRSVRLMLEQRGDAAEEAFFDFVYQPLFDDGGVVTGIAIVAFEVTQLAAARRDAEAANRAKDEFLAMLGHELRNPLAPILTALQLMQLRGVTGAERERSIIERQVKHMVGLVDDLLDISRITRGKVQLKKSRIDLADLVAKAIEMTAPAIEERRHSLQVSVERGMIVVGDPSRLAQVVANLMTNAAKYTDPGGRITVEGGVQGGHAVVRVIDTGIGIAPEMLPRVFELFSQERQNIDRSQGGLGLGLAIVRSLIQAHGGTVSAKSEGEGKGSEFLIRVPLAPAEDDRADKAVRGKRRREASKARRVLVVDDNLDAAELLADSLSAMGHIARVAFDGPSAIELAGTFSPDVALLDLGLPVMDGFELAERLRSDPRLSGMRLIALTGYGQDIDRQRTGRAGFQGHIVKPVDLEALDEWLREPGT